MRPIPLLRLRQRAGPRSVDLGLSSSCSAVGPALVVLDALLLVPGAAAAAEPDEDVRVAAVAEPEVEREVEEPVPEEEILAIYPEETCGIPPCSSGRRRRPRSTLA